MLVTLHQNALNCLSDNLHSWWSYTVDHAHVARLVDNNSITIQDDASLKETSGVQRHKEIILFSLFLMPVSVWDSYKISTLWLRKENSDDCSRPKWQNIEQKEKKTSCAQSIITQHTSYHQPAGQNVCYGTHMSCSVSGHGWLKRHSKNKGEVWVTFHINEHVLCSLDKCYRCSSDFLCHLIILENSVYLNQRFVSHS